MKIHKSIIVLLLFFVSSCKTVNQSSKYKKNVKTTENKKLKSNFSGKNNRSVQNILNNAEKLLGTTYKYGGNDSKGIDCSGFVCKVFKANDILLPRSSKEQSEMGKEINIVEVKPGDLLFFATSGGNKISHVGIVHTVRLDGEITFIHASTSKGVIISSLNEQYWNKAFLFAKRLN